MTARNLLAVLVFATMAIGALVGCHSKSPQRVSASVQGSGVPAPPSNCVQVGTNPLTSQCCSGLGTYVSRCETTSDWMAVAASTATTVFSMPLAADDDQDFTALIRVRVHGGSSSASNSAWWLRSFRARELSGSLTFTDPTGGTSDQAVNSQVGSALTGTTGTLTQSGNSLTASVTCNVICDVYADVSSARGAAHA